MADTKHTPLNWVQNGNNGIHTEQGNCIATTDGENRKANAELIVKAVNSHGRLIEALKLARKQMLKGEITVDNADAYNTIDNAIKDSE